MRNTGDPLRRRETGKPASRKGQAGSERESDEAIVPMKPGNSGGGKGLWFKVNVRSDESREIGDEPINSEDG
jgi:hypothetical protein